jgi:hypothetical protein
MQFTSISDISLDDEITGLLMRDGKMVNERLLA